MAQTHKFNIDSYLINEKLKKTGMQTESLNSHGQNRGQNPYKNTKINTKSMHNKTHQPVRIVCFVLNIYSEFCCYVTHKFEIGQTFFWGLQIWNLKFRSCFGPIFKNSKLLLLNKRPAID